MSEIVATGRKHRLSSPERRAAIIDAALHLFADKGFRGTTTREIAAAVGVSEPILYEHFPSKQDLYSAIIDHKSQQPRAELEELVNVYSKASDDRGFFTAVARALLGWYQSDPEFVRLLMFSGLERHDLKDTFYQRQSRQFLELIAGYIARRQEQGSLRALDPLVATRAIVGMVAHYGLITVMFACAHLDRSQDEVIDTMVDIFLNGVRTSPDGGAQK